MSKLRFTLIILVLSTISFTGMYLVSKDRNTFVVTWQQPTNDPKPISWPISFPYWTIDSYPTTGWYELVAVVKGTRFEVERKIEKLWPEAQKVKITHAPQFKLPSGWVWPDWINLD